MARRTRAPASHTHLTPIVAMSVALCLPLASVFAQTAPDPTLLPVATTSQTPNTGAYDGLNVPSKTAGQYYLDPTTGAKIYKLTDNMYPSPFFNWRHDYADGGNEVSLPYNGTTRAVFVRQNGGTEDPWLIDFTPGVGLTNARQLVGSLRPYTELAFTFSNNPATPYYAFVSNGANIERIDIRYMTLAPLANRWPVASQANNSGKWLHQSKNDERFVWMRASPTTIVGYDAVYGKKKTYSSSDTINEPRIDRGGRYVGVVLDKKDGSHCTFQDGNCLALLDWGLQIPPTQGSFPVVARTDGTIPFAHVASLSGQWLGVSWQDPPPYEFTMFKPLTSPLPQRVGGPSNGSLIHGSGNWIQTPANDDQWALFTSYGGLVPPDPDPLPPGWSGWLAPGGMILITRNGERRLLGHPYNTKPVADYASQAYAKFSPDGKYVLFTSDMNGTGRTDVFLAELPCSVNPAVTVMYPNGGNTLWKNSSVSLTWTPATASCGSISSVDLKLSRNGAGGVFEVIATGIPNSGSRSWTVTGPTTTNAFLKVVAHDTYGHSGEDLSNSAFTIAQCGPCLVSYCQGEGSRCTWNNTCGGGGCCNYSCGPDPTCVLPDPCPEGACGCF